jgi:endonuclease VIII
VCEDDLGSRVDVDPPAGMHRERASARPRAQPAADDLVSDPEGRPGAALVAGPVAARHERPVRDAERGHFEHRTEVERQPGATRMVAPRRVDDQHVGRLRQRSDGCLEQRPLTQCEEPRLVRCPGAALDDRDPSVRQRRGRPGRVACLARASLASDGADEARTKQRLGPDPPGRRRRACELGLSGSELLGRFRPFLRHHAPRIVGRAMPEGDSLHRAARRLQVLVGEQVAVETPHPRAAAQRVAERLDGRRLLAVEAVGKNLLLRFEGGLVLRSHLRMTGRWQVRERGQARRGTPWLVLAGREREAVLWNGPVLELTARGTRRLGPDILADPPDLEAMAANLRREHPSRELGDALLDQRLVAGIGNVWKAESLWRAKVSPWLPLGDVSDAELERVLGEAAALMRASVEGKVVRAVYRKAGRPCPRCGDRVRSRGQGDDNRTAYWCPGCQRSP